MKITSIILVFLFIMVGCKTTQSPADNPSALSTNEEKPLSLISEGKEISLSGKSLSLDRADSVELMLPGNCYTYVFKKQGNTVVALNQYWGTPLEDAKGVYSSMQDPDINNCDWFVVTSSSDLSNQEQKKFHQIAQSYTAKPSEEIYPKRGRWQIFTSRFLGNKFSPIKLRGDIAITQAPFSFQLYAQKQNESEFKSVSIEKYRNLEGANRQLKFHAHKEMYTAIFLREENKVRQIFPRVNDSLPPKIKENTVLSVPIETDAKIQEALCFFCSPEPMTSCKTLVEWLEQGNIRSEGTELSRGYAKIVAVEVPAPLYWISID